MFSWFYSFSLVFLSYHFYRTDNKLKEFFYSSCNHIVWKYFMCASKLHFFCIFPSDCHCFCWLNTRSFFLPWSASSDQEKCWVQLECHLYSSASNTILIQAWHSIEVEWVLPARYIMYQFSVSFAVCCICTFSFRTTFHLLND